MNIAICYDTWCGHTERVAHEVGEHLASRGLDVRVVQCRDADAVSAVRDVDAVVVGSPIRGGRLNAKVIAFAKKNAETLRLKKVGLFVVCLTAKSDTPDARNEVGSYLTQFSESTGIHPLVSAPIAGALLYTGYNSVIKMLMKKISEDQGGDTDTSRDFVYTDWEQVRSFAGEFAEILGSGA